MLIQLCAEDLMFFPCLRCETQRAGKILSLLYWLVYKLHVNMDSESQSHLWDLFVDALKRCCALKCTNSQEDTALLIWTFLGFFSVSGCNYLLELCCSASSHSAFASGNPQGCLSGLFTAQCHDSLFNGPRSKNYPTSVFLQRQPGFSNSCNWFYELQL